MVREALRKIKKGFLVRCARVKKMFKKSESKSEREKEREKERKAKREKEKERERERKEKKERRERRERREKREKEKEKERERRERKERRGKGEKEAEKEKERKSSSSSPPPKKGVSFGSTTIIPLYQEKKDTLYSSIFKYLSSPPPSHFHLPSFSSNEDLINSNNFTTENKLEEKIIEKINEKNRNILLIKELLSKIRGPRESRKQSMDIIKEYSSECSDSEEHSPSSQSSYYAPSKCLSNSSITSYSKTINSTISSMIRDHLKNYQ